MDSLNNANFSKVVECVFGFTDKCLRVAHYDLEHVPMKGLGSKPLRIHLGSIKDI